MNSYITNFLPKIPYAFKTTTHVNHSQQEVNKQFMKTTLVLYDMVMVTESTHQADEQTTPGFIHNTYTSSIP